jgi:molybdopterin-guanine dinucleotide biosynthesis protein A
MPSRRDDVTAVILAGGAARRLGGATKPLLTVDGARILDRQLAVVADRVRGVVVAAQADAAWARAAGLPVVLDQVADGGPLAGIAGALAAVATPWILVIAGDMPWIDGAVVDEILEGAVSVDAVVPRVNGYPEPLLAAYHARARPTIDDAVVAGEKSPSRLVQSGALLVRWIEELVLRERDPGLRSFTSVNSPADLAG